MTEPDAAIELPGTAPSAEARRRSNLQLAAGILVFLAASAAVLLVAGNLGAGGVLVAALMEAVAIGWLYRWCEA